MSFFARYSTVFAVRELYIGSTSDKRDDFYTELIERVSRQIDAACQRVFVPRILTHEYDTPEGSSLTFDDDLLEIISLTNGDGSAISSYKLYPLNTSAKYKLTLTTSAPFLPDASGYSEGAIELVGIFGYHDRYAEAWVDRGAQVSGSLSSSATSLTGISTGTVRAGELIRIGTEYLFVKTVSIDTTNGDTLTVARGANGSTAAAHSDGDSITTWSNPLVEELTTTAVVAYARLKDNPAGESQNIGGNVFVTPRDVLKWIEKRVSDLALIRGSFF